MSDIEQDYEKVTADAVRRAKEEDLLPTGTYEGVIVDYKRRIIDREDSPLFGEAMTRATVELYNVEGRTRKHSFDLTGAALEKADGKLRSESKLAGQLAKSVGMVDVPLNSILEAAKMTRLRYRIRKSEETAQYDARNWLDAIAPVR